MRFCRALNRGGRRLRVHSKLSGFYVHGEAGFAVALRAVEGQACCPVTAHVGSNLHAVSARCVGAFDRRAGVHDHARHVHAEVEFHLAGIHQLAACVAKFDECLVGGGTQLSVRMQQRDRQSAGRLRGERSAGTFGTARELSAELLPAVVSANSKRSDGKGCDEESREAAARAGGGGRALIGDGLGMLIARVLR